MSCSRSLYEQLMEWQSVHAAQQHGPAKLALPGDDTDAEVDVSVEYAEGDEVGCSPDWRERLAALRAIGEEASAATRRLSSGRTICRRLKRSV